MNRIFVREREDFEYSLKSDKTKIGIVGMSRGAGASFIATSVAKELSLLKKKRIAFVEGCKNVDENRGAHLYDSLGMDRRFVGRTFTDFYDEVKRGMSINGRINLDEGINWVLYVPQSIGEHDCEQNEELTNLKFASLINNVVADVVICDLNEYAKDNDILMEMDFILFVIDPLPSKLISGYTSLCRIKKLILENKKVVFLLNKDNEGINRGELLDFIRINPKISIPLLGQEKIYTAEYNCKIPYTQKELNVLIKPQIKEIIDLLEGVI